VATDVRFREGKFKLADGGTLFLNEIGDLSPMIQSKLLLALQDGTIERVGGQPMSVDVRVIAATNRDLAGMVQNGTFRQDLYYRINALQVYIPPLRERMADIVPLARNFLAHFCAKYGKAKLMVKDEVYDELLAYSWPGNVRELKGMIQRGVLLAKDNYFPTGIIGSAGQHQDSPAPHARKLPDILEDVERRHIIEALELDGYHQTKAANRLGLKESTLRTKMAKLGIKTRRRL
jgi:Nif-specific regulatory protein